MNFPVTEPFLITETFVMGVGRFERIAPGLFRIAFVSVQTPFGCDGVERVVVDKIIMTADALAELQSCAMNVAAGAPSRTLPPCRSQSANTGGTDMRESPWQPPFRQVSDMETPLTTIDDLAVAIALITETMDDGTQSAAVQRLAFLIRDEMKKAEQLRGELFELLHPNRPATEAASE